MQGIERTTMTKRRYLCNGISMGKVLKLSDPQIRGLAPIIKIISFLKRKFQ
jgi:hypothetical protein